MGETLETIVAVMFFGTALGVQAYRYWHRRRSTTRAALASTGDQCISCNGTSLTLLAPMVYRCNACGHEGGDGRAAWERARRNEELRSWSPARRRETAERDLSEARTVLIAGIGEIERAIELDRARDEDGEPVPEYYRRMTDGLGFVLEGQGKILDAYVKLALPVEPLVSTDLGPEDTPGVLIEHANAMLAAVETGLESLHRGTVTG